MAKRKLSKKYYFSVEGETEQWYLYWLRDMINNNSNSAYNVTIDCKIEKNPLKRAKGLVTTGKTEIYHLSDYESSDYNHKKQFESTMDNMKKAMNIGKSISYKLGYSNFTFDLWIILHKIDCNGTLSHRNGYIQFINKAFNERFENMSEYKHEDNFKRCLNQLSLNDVIKAIQRSEYIMKQNELRGYVLNNYKGFSYYKENPSLDIWKAIKKIMVDCKLI